eukprot:CAMPEP_0206588764 /NCGR_PEP_ID=MMETSP0325_2-20121206/38492_1 /ASSEMBLY_ACC=CAM_ASM_000347 /TAXON_ID=2866 /ORGANISM="Crypthecodinium cohnii, Strain Seligo" /LENGTH=166 /DNA_ID=CAMNT_0054097135 /DNA_START=23 /DNA_END=523 /DNA_ORIENTATION=-
MGNLVSGPEPPSVTGANAHLTKGERVQTQYTLEEGGDGRWYCGHVARLYENGNVKIKYDDGDQWKGPGIYVWSLAGPPPPVSNAQGVPQVVQATVVTATPPLPQIPQSELAKTGEPTCPVCTVYKMDMALGCGHRLCGSCLTGVHANGAICPVCRAPIKQIIRCYN